MKAYQMQRELTLATENITIHVVDRVYNICFDF